MQLFARDQPFQDFSNLNDPPTPNTCLRHGVNWGPVILRHAQITMEHGMEHGMTFGALWRLSSCVKTWWISIATCSPYILPSQFINQITKTMPENHNICPLKMEPRKTRISQYILENLLILAEDLGLIYFNFNWLAGFLNPWRWDQPFVARNHRESRGFKGSMAQIPVLWLFNKDIRILREEWTSVHP